MSKIIENIKDIDIKDINTENVKSIINNYEWLMMQVERLVDDKEFYEVEKMELNSDNDLLIYYETYSYGSSEHMDISVPIAWLFLDNDELRKAKKRRKAEEDKKRREQERLNRIAIEKQAEQREREEYERLKAKFETKGKEHKND